MSHLLKTGKYFFQRTFLRQVRTLVIFLSIPLAFWLIPLPNRILGFTLFGFGSLLVFYDYRRPKKALLDRRISVQDYLIIFGTNSFLLGLTLLTGGMKSPLIPFLTIPILLFTLEFNRQIGYLSSIPLIIMFAANFEKQVIGAPQFWLTQISLLLLVGVMIHTLGSYEKISFRHDQKILRFLLQDELTGLFNRRYLKTIIKQTLKNKFFFALIMMDINYFKYYNDYLGHSGGDSLLVQLGRTLKYAVHESDTVVRYSGDEFIIFLPHAGQPEVDSAIQAINQRLTEFYFPGEECFPNGKLSLTYGTCLSPNQTNYDQIIYTVDHDLRHNKQKR